MSLSKKDVKELEEQHRKDIETRTRMMMDNPGIWSRWPWLPLKRYGSEPHRRTEVEYGLLHADDTESFKKPRVYKENLFLVGRWYPKPDVPFTQYDSLDAILADGWVID